MRKTCHECEQEFQGRLDAKFCSADCRSTYHNRVNYEKRAFQRKINKILWNNRQLLHRMNPRGKKSVSHEKLLESGFNFNYFTNIYTTKSGTEYKFCYDYGYFESGNSYYTIVKREEYVD